ncbi:hypothetical protein KEM56_002910 [Ascosphaera pollenicola]|nr:hypothetical protein KEM56_002910 [Ascosphaera pollenicola]
MPLTILTRKDLKSLLLSLTKEQVLKLQCELADGLFDYSTGVGASPSNPKFQPPRTVITRPDGLTTLFMPASAGPHIGMRVMSAYHVSADDGSTEDPHHKGSVTRTYFPPTYTIDVEAGAQDGSRRGSASDLRSSSNHRKSADSSTLSVATQSTPDAGNNDDDDIPGTPLSTLPETLRGALPDDTIATSPNGCVTLLDSTGRPAAMINAQELSAFRTALSTSIFLMRRKHVETITVFGAGRQAYWHIYIALLLRGEDIKHVNIINRSFDRTTQLLRDFYDSSRVEWRSNVKFATMCRDFVEYDRLVDASVRKADVIFCCTPSVEPLFRGNLITHREGRRKGRLVVAIGSYTPEMVELDPEILKFAVKQHHPNRYRAHIKHPLSVGVVVVDCLDACLTQCGEVIRAGLEPRQLVELGELVMVRQEASRGSIQEGDDGEEVLSAEDRQLFQWMRKGLVVFKSVGMGLMDIIVGEEILKIAREMEIGTNIDDF